MSTTVVHHQDLPPLDCPFCKVPFMGKDDKFCRKCGYRMLQCAKCSQPVREGDRYCGSCGSKRCHLLELWRQGALHKSPCFVGSVILIVGASWLTLRYLLRRSH